MHANTIFRTAAALLMLTGAAACSNAGTSSSTAATPEVSAPAVKASSAVVSTGTFTGRSDHITTGHVTLEKTAAGYQLNFASDFSLDGAPDPIVAIGNGDTYVAANKISTLQNLTGAQSYALPASFTPAEFSQVYVWCEKFNVPLGIANLN